jgi:hypothetical protein
MRRFLIAIIIATAVCYAAEATDVAPKPDANAGQAMAVPPQGSQALVGLPIYSSDQKKIGRVNSIDAGPGGTIKTLQAEIEGFLGLGTSSVRFTSDQFKQMGDRIVLLKTADQVRGVPSESYRPLH